MLANGSSAPIEKLSFIHQDASGASVQQTRADGTLSGSARTGEYDALGRNVADASPFINLNTSPPPVESGSGTNLFGTSAGYRPGAQVYRVDGQIVPQAEFARQIESGSVGGMFGLLELTARMSVREVGRFTRTIEWGGVDENGTVHTNTASRTRIIYQYNNWSVSLTILP